MLFVICRYFVVKLHVVPCPAAAILNRDLDVRPDLQG